MNCSIVIPYNYPIVKRKDEAKLDGAYRTKRVVNEINDAIPEFMQTGTAYQTHLNSNEH